MKADRLPAIGFSALWVSSTFLHAAAFEDRTFGSWLLALPVLAVALAFLLHAPMRRMLLVISRMRPLERGLTVSAMVAAGFLLTWAIPLQPVPSESLVLQVMATGQKAPSAVSSEVWVRLERDGQPIPASEFQHDGTWEERGEFLLSVPAQQPGRATWAERPSGHIRAIFVSHPWSGMATISLNGRERILDLYSAGSSASVIELSSESQGNGAVFLSPRTPIQYAVRAVDGLAIAAALLLAYCLVLGRKQRKEPILEIPYRTEILLHAAPTLLAGAFLLGLFFPGLMTSDSLDQWRQAGVGRYNDAHPFVYALAMRVARLVADSPALIAITQVALVAFSTAWLITIVRRGLKVGLIAAQVSAWLVAVHPMLALTNITLWKDVPYTVAVTVLTCYVARAVFDPEARLSWRHVVGLAVAAACCMLLRHNGLPVALGAVGILWMCSRVSRARVSAAAFGGIAMFLIVQGPIARHFEVQRAHLSYALFAHHIGAHLSRGHLPESKEDRSVIRHIDVSDPTWRYSCTSVNPMIYNPAFDAAYASAHHKQLRSIWLELAMRSPVVELRHLACSSALVWRGQGSSLFYLAGIAVDAPHGKVRWIVGEPDDPQERTIFPAMAQLIGKKLVALNATPFLRPAGYLFFLLFTVVAVSRYHRNWKLLLIVAPVMLHTVVLSLVVVAQDARYQLPVYVAALCLVPLFFAGKEWLLTKPESAATSGDAS